MCIFGTDLFGTTHLLTAFRMFSFLETKLLHTSLGNSRRDAARKERRREQSAKEFNKITAKWHSRRMSDVDAISSKRTLVPPRSTRRPRKNKPAVIKTLILSDVRGSYSGRSIGNEFDGVSEHARTPERDKIPRPVLASEIARREREFKFKRTEDSGKCQKVISIMRHRRIKRNLSPNADAHTRADESREERRAVRYSVSAISIRARHHLVAGLISQ